MSYKTGCSYFSVISKQKRRICRKFNPAVYGGADKSLAQPGRKQTTVTEVFLTLHYSVDLFQLPT